MTFICILWHTIFEAHEFFNFMSTRGRPRHYSDVRMGTIASQITSLTIVYSIVYSDADQRKHQSSASLAFVRGIHRGPVNSQMASDAENVSIWWRHHEQDQNYNCCTAKHVLCITQRTFHVNDKRNNAIPMWIWRNNCAIMTSERRRDVVLTSQWRYYCVAYPLGCHQLCGNLTDHGKCRKKT